MTSQDVRLAPFVANDYRKQVLAPIVTRGGDPQISDTFELYALPLEAADQPDPVIVDRIDEVWGFWQRHRDQPKYRVLVAQLVAEHEERSAPLRVQAHRVQLADRIRRQRESRDQTRFEALDMAIRRLVERYRGIPEDKVEGLCDLAAADHIGRDEALQRMRRHRRVPAVGSETVAASAVDRPVPTVAVDPAIAERARQVRDLLDELGRRADSPPPTTLFDLLDLEPDAAPAQIGDRARMWRARSREMPVGRARAVIDELLVHVQHLLEAGPTPRGGYLDAVAAQVRERLRPRMRAAILVEDALLPDDRHYLTDEAIALGLDHARAARVVSELAAELTAAGRPRATGPITAVQPVPPTASSPAPPPVESRRRESRQGSPESPTKPVEAQHGPVDSVLRSARAALRAGRCAEARTTVDRAAARTDPAFAAVSADIDEVIAAARLRWRAAVSAHEAGRHAEAVGHLEHLRRTASDLPYPGDRRFDLDELLDRSRAAVAAADRLVAEAIELPETDRTARLLEAVAVCVEHPEAMARLASIAVGAPGAVRTARIPAGVEVIWEPSPTPDVRYRVARVDAVGTRRVVGRTAATSIIDGAVAPGEPIPVYVVTAQQTGRTSPEATSAPPAVDAEPGPGPDQPTAPPGVPAPRGLVVRAGSASIVIAWEPVPGATYKVTRLDPNGAERVVGRTAAPMIEDGGAPPGTDPVYEVIALRDGSASPSVRSDR